MIRRPPRSTLFPYPPLSRSLFVAADKKILRYAGAGHPPLVFGTVKGKGTTFREIDSNGLLLGLSEDAAYTSLELPFRPGDRCLLYTDGMLEEIGRASCRERV